MVVDNVVMVVDNVVLESNRKLTRHTLIINADGRVSLGKLCLERHLVSYMTNME